MTKRDKQLREPQPSRPRSKADNEGRPIFEFVPQDATTGVVSIFSTWLGEETNAELLALLKEIDG
jgi:hypothetical protein